MPFHQDIELNSFIKKKKTGSKVIVTDLTCYVQDGENKASSRTSRSAVEEKGFEFPGV